MGQNTPTFILRSIAILLIIGVISFFAGQYYMQHKADIDGLLGQSTDIEVENVVTAEVEEIAPVQGGTEIDQVGATSEQIEESPETVSTDVNQALDDVTNTLTDTVKNTKETLSDAAAKMVETTVETTKDQAEETLNSVKDAADEAVNKVVENGLGAANEGGSTLNQLTESAGEITKTLTKETLDSASNITESLSETAKGTVDSLSETVTNSLPDTLSAFTPENFNVDKIIEVIENADISETQKAALSTAVEAAKNNPDLIQATLTRIKEALGF